MDNVKSKIQDYAKDIRVNLGNLSNTEHTPGLTQRQNDMVFLVSGYATHCTEIIENSLSSGRLSEEDVHAVKAAASIMAMNTVYYRSLHLAEHEGLNQLPAKLRMTIIGNPGIEKTDFELLCLAVAAIAGCGKCLAAHLHELEQQGVSAETMQSAIRIASVVNAAHMALSISETKVTVG